MLKFVPTFLKFYRN